MIDNKDYPEIDDFLIDGEELLREFQEYMEESIRQSIINQAKAIESASKIIIF